MRTNPIASLTNCGRSVLIHVAFFCFAATSHASVQTFFGSDLGAGPGGPHPNSDAARVTFLANVLPASVGTEDFESVSLGAFPGGTRSIAFPSTAVTGTIQDLVNGATANVAEIRNTPVLSHWFAISGTTYFFTEANEGTAYFDLTLSSAVSAIGFYGTSFSDYSGVPGGPFTPIQIILDGGSPIDVIEADPATITDGSVHFFGLISDTPFTTVRLFNPLQADTFPFPLTDGVAIDEITIGLTLDAVPEPSMLLVFSGLASTVFCLVNVSRRLQSKNDC